jgi:hypothetical protein
MSHRKSFLLCVAVFAFTLLHIKAQQGHSIGLQPPQEQNALSSGNSPTYQEKMAHWANVARQKQLVKDSAKLVELTAQLKQHRTEQSNNKVTDEDLRLLTQIEKLAHNIRVGMAFAGEAPPPAHTSQQSVW